MAEDSPSVEDEETLPVHVLSIGWHMVQGAELSGYYASAAESSDDKWVPFFREVEEGYRKLLEDAASRLPPSILKRGGRPPY